MKAESSPKADVRRPGELVSPIVEQSEDQSMEADDVDEGDDLYRDDEEGFGLDLNREETWEELERRGQEEELDEDGFGPDLNREAVWEELEKRGNRVIAEKTERGLSQEAAESCGDGPRVAHVPRSGSEEAREPEVARVPRTGTEEEEAEDMAGMRKSRGLPSPQRVSRKEREEHARTHTISQLVRTLREGERHQNAA